MTKHVNDKTGMRKAVRFLSVMAAVLFCLGVMYMPVAWAQIDSDDAYELIVQVKRKDRVLSNTLLGYQVGYSSYYLPVGELGRLLEFYTDLDLEQQSVSGWFSDTSNAFTLNLKDGYYTMGGQVTDLAPDDAFIKDYGSNFGDIYVKIERLNEMLPLGVAFDFQQLSMNLTTPVKLPLERRWEREAHRERAMARMNKSDPQFDGYMVHNNPYRMYSPPILDIDAQIGRQSYDKKVMGDLNLYGRNDLLGFSADYNARFAIEDGRAQLPDNIRALFTRRAYGDDAMPLGVRELQIGDMSLNTPRLLVGRNAGRGVSISSRPVQREQNFDEVTIEGTGIPGYEIELYRNGELVDFGVVAGDGQYRFTGQQLLAGRNIFRTVLYGPQGQEEERIEEYSIAGSMLNPGELEYQMGIVDTQDSLINFDRERMRHYGGRERGQGDQGISYSGRVARGINNNLTLFATGTNSFTRQGERQYGTVGANFGVGNVLGSAEIYKEIGGGAGVDTRASTVLHGWNMNLRTGLFRDFESDRTGFENSARVFDIEARVNKRFATALGVAGLQLSGDFEELESGVTSSRYGVTTTLAKGAGRFGNTITATYREGDLNHILGRANANFRLSRHWNSRSILNYRVNPEWELQSFSTDLRYRPDRDFWLGFNYNQNLIDTADRRFGADIGYDFGTFLGSVNTSWNHNDGVNVMLRASTTLAPFNNDGSYKFDSRTGRNYNAVRNRVFLDRNLNNIFDEGDEWLPDTGIYVGGRETALTDEAGRVAFVQSTNGEYQAVTIDEDRLPNPFLRPAQKGHLVLVRPGVAQDIDIAMVETGMIDGSAYFENGDPIPGLKMELVSGTGEVIQTVMTSYDGFFAFEFVKPGTYIIRADPALNVMVPPRTVSVSSDALFAYGVDVNMKNAPQSAIQIEKTQVKQNIGSILSGLQKLQSTLSGAVGVDTAYSADAL